MIFIVKKGIAKRGCISAVVPSDAHVEILGKSKIEAQVDLSNSVKQHIIFEPNLSKAQVRVRPYQRRGRLVSGYSQVREQAAPYGSDILSKLQDIQKKEIEAGAAEGRTIAYPRTVAVVNMMQRLGAAKTKKEVDEITSNLDSYLKQGIGWGASLKVPGAEDVFGEAYKQAMEKRKQVVNVAYDTSPLDALIEHYRKIGEKGTHEGQKKLVQRLEDLKGMFDDNWKIGLYEESQFPTLGQEVSSWAKYIKSKAKKDFLIFNEREFDDALKKVKDSKGKQVIKVGESQSPYAVQQARLRAAIKWGSEVYWRPDLTTQLKIQEGTGLGGGQGDTISLTEDEDVAKGIYNGILEARRVVLNEYTIEQMVKDAIEGKGAKRPWINDLKEHWHIKTDVSEKDIAAIAVKRFTYDVTGGWPKTLAKLEKEMIGRSKIYTPPQKPQLGWKGVEPVFKVIDGENLYLNFIREKTEEEKMEARMDFFKQFCAFREAAGGPYDPLFFNNDVANLSKLNPKDIGLLKFEGKGEGFKPGGEAEWRIFSGHDVEFSEDLTKSAQSIKGGDKVAYMSLLWSTLRKMPKKSGVVKHILFESNMVKVKK